ncbi:MAG: ABC transporter substrate-binding protein, partial [Anaerolineales bacterium]
MNSKNKWLFILITLTLVVSLVGCQQKPQSSGPVTIRVFGMDQAAMTPEEMKAIADEFMQKNPDIKVELEFAAYDAMHDKIVTAMASTPPSYDVFEVDDPWYAEFVKAGYLADVSDRITDKMKSDVF